MMYLLQVTEIMVKLDGLETVIGAVYQSPCKPFVNAGLDTLVGLSKSKKFIFGGDLNAKHQDWNSRLIHRMEDFCQDMQIGINMQSPHRMVLLSIRIDRMRILTYWTSFNVIRSSLWKM
jgi:hypothetical protein